MSLYGVAQCAARPGARGDDGAGAVDHWSCLLAGCLSRFTQAEDMAARRDPHITLISTGCFPIDSRQDPF